jgi:hypothetical protein
MKMRNLSGIPDYQIMDIELDSDMKYFEALEFARNELTQKIPTGFFEGRYELSMKDLMDGCWKEASRLYELNPTPGGKLEDILDSGYDGYLPYCYEPDGRTSLFNTLGYNSEVHEYNLWILYEFLKSGGMGELNFLPTTPNTDRVDKLCGIT